MNFLNPYLIIAVTISSYWFCVMVMSLRSWLKFRVPSGSLPKTKLEKKMWIAWVPTIVAWISIAWSANNDVGETTVFAWSGWLFSFVAVIAFMLTMNCWIKMGRNWSMAVRPDKKTELITDGMFSKVRHPIYSLSLTLMICSVFVIKSWGIVLVALVHISLLVLKSASEEKYLTNIHGQQYLDYLQQTNRFVPLKILVGKNW